MPAVNDALEEFTARFYETSGPPGLSVALAERGQTFAAGYGQRDREAGLAIEADTVFAVASVSKVFVGIAVSQLAERDALRLDDPVTRWLPELATPHAREITLHHLLTHSAGLPGLPSRYHAVDRLRPGVFNGGNLRVDSEVIAGRHADRAGIADCAGLIAFLNGYTFEPLAPPGELHSYSNESYILLSGVVETASGLPYPEYLRRHVFGPAGMETTFPGYASLPDGVPVATRYVASEDGPTPIEPWDAPAWVAPGGLLSTPRDLVRLLGAVEAEKLLSRTSLERLIAPHARCSATGMGYGYGVGVRDGWHGFTYVQHGGGQMGVSSAFAWIPERGIAAAAVANAEGDIPARWVRGAVCTALELPEETPLFDWAAEDADASALADCAGRYSTPEGQTFDFEIDGERFGLRLGDALIEARSLGPDHVLIANQVVRFLRRDGKVWAAAAEHRVVRRE